MQHYSCTIIFSLTDFMIHSPITKAILHISAAFWFLVINKISSLLYQSFDVIVGSESSAKLKQTKYEKN
jgi:hypothetical protein